MIKIKLDYSIESPQDRNTLLTEILSSYSPDSPPPAQYLEAMSNYLINSMEKQERKEKKILTENRLSTVNKRETSFEGLAAQFENGEDGVYNLIKPEDKSQFFQPKDSITKEDIASIPELAQISEAIQLWKNKLARASGRDAYIIKKAIIDLQKDQYLVRASYKTPVVSPISFTGHHATPIEEEITIDCEGTPTIKGASLLDPTICSAILCDYSRLKESVYSNFRGDLWYLMEAFDQLAQVALGPYPHLEALTTYKIDGLTNQQIKDRLQLEFGLSYSVEHISSLWRNKIPNLIAYQAEEQYLDYYYREIEKGEYKKCTKCNQIKLRLPRYFSKNKTSKDGYYSICKKCRNTKKGGFI